jgi:hypothetical protein
MIVNARFRFADALDSSVAQVRKALDMKSAEGMQAALEEFRRNWRGLNEQKTAYSSAIEELDDNRYFTLKNVFRHNQIALERCALALQISEDSCNYFSAGVCAAASSLPKCIQQVDTDRAKLEQTVVYS